MIQNNVISTYRFSDLYHDLLAGGLSATVNIAFVIADAMLVFSGLFQADISMGISMGLISVAFAGTIISLFSDYKLTAVSLRGVVIFALCGISLSQLFGQYQSTAVILMALIFCCIVSSIATGILLYLIGHFKLGNIVRFIPYQVSLGLSAGMGLLIITSSSKIITGISFNYGNFFNHISIPTIAFYEQWSPTIIFSILLFAVSYVFRNKIFFIIMLAAGVITFYLWVMLAHKGLQQLFESQLLIGKISSNYHPNFLILTQFNKVNWTLVTSQIKNLIPIFILLPLGLLFSLASLEIANKRELDINHEIKITGVASILSAMLGGAFNVSHSTVITELNRECGARSRLAGLFSSLLIVLVLYFAVPYIGFLPKFIFCGLLFYIGYKIIFNWLTLAVKQLSLADFTVSLVIFISINIYGLFAGVVLGIFFSAIFFIIRYSRISSIKSMRSLADAHSNVERDFYSKSIIQKYSRHILILELQGFLFFGNTEYIKEKIFISMKINPINMLVIDFNLVNGFDSSSIFAFIMIMNKMEELDCLIIFSHLPSDLKKEIEKITIDNSQCHFFNNLDYALEWCEERILTLYEKPDTQLKLSLSNQLFEKIGDKKIAQGILNYLVSSVVPPNEKILKQGDIADSMYFIESGRVDVILHNPQKGMTRLRTMNAGTIIGEIALYTKSKRSATIISRSECKLYILTSTQLNRMEIEQPELALWLHRFVVLLLSERLQYAGEQILGLLDQNEPAV